MSSPAERQSTSYRGRRGEDAACRLLQAQGVEVLERNFRTRRGEVDIIARDQQALCFIEVKSWRRQLWPDLKLSVDSRKCQRIRNTALHWLDQHRDQANTGRLRFDLFLYDPENGSHEWLTGALDY